jgi:Icc-related predicted phosphoesterase
MEKIQVISDTHGFHNQVFIQDNVDCIIHCGDSTNYYDIYHNQPEFDDFISWYSTINVEHKILIPGNHDSWSMKKYNIDKVKSLGIIYLEHEYYKLEGLKIFGSPYTPTFGNWHHMKDRAKLFRYWEELEENIDILITHGPPYGILDLSENRDGQLENCGDKALFKKILKVQPKYHCFGHIHNNNNCYNQGTRTIQGCKTTFMNCSMVEDGKFSKGLINNGLIINLK